MMNRLTLHHSAGNYKVSTLDLQHYHRITSGDGEVVSGKFGIDANAAGRKLAAGTYAAHTLNLNSGNIGLSMACMAGAEWATPRTCPTFPTNEQIDAMLREAANLCVQYSIEPERKTLLSHAEVEVTLGVKQRGKWDFDYFLLGKGSGRDPVAVGDEIRQAVKALIVNGGIKPVVYPRKTVRRGDSGQDVRDLQKALGLAVDGTFGPMTWAAVVAFQKKRSLLPDGVVGRMTWAALGL